METLTAHPLIHRKREAIKNLLQISLEPLLYHFAQVYTFKGLHWCDFCNHFIWGIVQQGVKCNGALASVLYNTRRSNA